MLTSRGQMKDYLTLVFLLFYDHSLTNRNSVWVTTRFALSVHWVKILLNFLRAFTKSRSIFSAKFVRTNFGTLIRKFGAFHFRIPLIKHVIGSRNVATPCVKGVSLTGSIPRSPQMHSNQITNVPSVGLQYINNRLKTLRSRRSWEPLHTVSILQFSRHTVLCVKIWATQGLGSNFLENEKHFTRH